MPQKIKYVGPKDSKEFHGFQFLRDVTTDASGGRNAVEVPDPIANAALKHPSVFLQWDRPVPEKTKAQRQQLPSALEAEGKAHYKTFAKRLYAAELLEEDSPAAIMMKKKEIAGAEEQMAHGERLIAEARAMREGTTLESSLGELVADGAPDASQADLLTIIKELQAQLAEVRADKAAGRVPEGELAEIAASLQEDVTSTLELTVSELNLSAAVAKALVAGEVTSVAWLIQHTREDLTSVPGIGPVALDTIEDALAAKGLKLRATAGA